MARAEGICREGASLDYRRLELAVEIEWSPHRDDREYDFAKLADIRATHRAFVCGANVCCEDEALKEVVRPLQTFLNRHQYVTKEDAYLVIVDGYWTALSEAQDPWGWILRKREKPDPLPSH